MVLKVREKAVLHKATPEANAHPKAAAAKAVPRKATPVAVKAGLPPELANLKVLDRANSTQAAKAVRLKVVHRDVPKAIPVANGLPASKGEEQKICSAASAAFFYLAGKAACALRRAASVACQSRQPSVMLTP